jgi:phage-related protein
MKPLKFMGSALDDLRDFPLKARRDCGRELNRVQSGFDAHGLEAHAASRSWSL